MTPERTPALAESHKAQPSASNTLPQFSGGLYLSGIVIASRVEDKEWEGKKYKQFVVSISDGEQVFLWRERIEGGEYDLPKMLSQIRLRVKRATTEKGQITVSGVLVA